MPQYQGVWTLEAQAQAQSNQQWVTDPNFKNTTLLLQADGTGSGSQNQTFLDGSTNNFFITRNGNTTQGSFSPFSQAPGYWSNYFNGSGSGPYLRFGSSSALTFGTGDFTIEFWVYFVSINDGTINYIYDLRDGGVGSFFVQEPANTWTYRNGADALVTTGLTSTTFSANQWYHVAVCRASGVINFYVNGKKVSADPADTSNYATTYLSIMSRSASDGGNNNTNSYTSNFRVVKGTALYTANFTPQTTPLTAITNTSLLTCQSNRFVDNSANALAATVDTGQPPSVQAFGPFAPALQWTPDVVGGSGYFDGSGDYLTGPSASGGDFSTGDFTISCWFYPTTLTGGVNHGVMSYADTGGWNGWQLQARGSTKDMLFEFLTGSAGASQITGGTIVLNAWNYVVVTRSGSTLNLYVNSTSVAATTTNSTAYGASTSRVIVGADRSAASPFIGYISNSKLVKQANAPASIPTVPDTNTTNTSLLLNYTNAGIYDGKMANVLETVGNAQVATSPVKYGSGSMYFDGSGDYLYLPASQSTVFGTGDFTIEFWVFYASASGSYIMFDSRGTSVSQTGVAINTASGSIYVNNGTSNIITGTAPTANAWHHIALTRTGAINKLFIDGVQTGSTATSSTNYATGYATGIGTTLDSAYTASYYLNGYIDDLRITKGVCRYFTTFTPPQQALPRQ